MKRLALLALLFPLSAAARAQYAPASGLCTLGGVKASTSGLLSTNYLAGVVPYCTVTVYLTGTTNKATIYSTATGGSLTNPFWANTATSSNAGGWIFYAATSQGYDVVLSGGIPPNVYTSPVTLTDVFTGGTGGGGGCGTGTNCIVTNPTATQTITTPQGYAFVNNGATSLNATDPGLLAPTNINGDTSDAITSTLTWDDVTKTYSPSGHYQQVVGNAQNINFNVPGWNYGTNVFDPGIIYSGGLWSVSTGFVYNINFDTQGIGSGISMTCNKYATGDHQCLNIYDTSTGGNVDGSGQGNQAVLIQGGQAQTWFKGTAAAATTGSTALVANQLSGGYGQPAQGGFLLDMSRRIATGNANGISTYLGGTGLPVTPVDFSVTPSTCIAVLMTSISPPANPTVAEPVTVNVAPIVGSGCVNDTFPATTWIAGADYPEQTRITAHGTTSATVAISAWTLSSCNVSTCLVTFNTATQSLTAGSPVVVRDFGTSTYFNGLVMTVNSGVNSTQFSATIPSVINGISLANGTATESGNIAGTQSLAFNHLNLNSRYVSYIVQGGTSGFASPSFYQNYTVSGQPWYSAWYVFGAIDSSHIIIAFHSTGHLNDIPNNLTADTYQRAITNINCVSGACTATFSGYDFNGGYWNAQPFGILAGTSGGALDGLAQQFAVDYTGQNLTFTDGTLTGTSSTGNLTAYTLFGLNIYPGATVIQPATPCNTSPCTIPLEPNPMVVTAGDSMWDILNPAFNGSQISAEHRVFSPEAGDQTEGIGQFNQYIVGTPSGDYLPRSITSNTPCFQYIYCGGALLAPRLDLIDIPNRGTVYYHLPLGSPLWTIYGCAPVNCSNLNPFDIFAFPSSMAGSLSYIPGPNTFWSHNSSGGSGGFAGDPVGGQIAAPRLCTGGGLDATVATMMSGPCNISGSIEMSTPNNFFVGDNIRINTNGLPSKYVTLGYGNQQSDGQLGIAKVYTASLNVGAIPPLLSTSGIFSAPFGQTSGVIYTYACAAVTANGTTLTGGNIVATGYQSTTLDPMVHYNEVWCPAGAGGQSIAFYRISAPGTSYSPGLLTNCSSTGAPNPTPNNGALCYDYGQSASGSIPSSDTSGYVNLTPSFKAAVQAAGVPFSAIATGTNTTAAMVVGTGASLSVPTQSAGDASTLAASDAFVAATLPVSYTATPTGGSGTGTVTCLTATCTNLRGTYSVAGGTFTTGTLLALAWTATPTVYVCTATQNGLATVYGIGHSVATTTGMNITNAVSVAATTITIDYSCEP